MNKVLIIHPQDATTDFLKKVTEPLLQKFKDQIVLINPDYRYNSHNLDEDIAKHYQGPNCSIIFMGHGHSERLSGGVNPEKRKSLLLSAEEAKTMFYQKNVILFSCYSDRFLKIAGIEINAYLGFGNMPTDWSEANPELQFSGAYKYLTSQTISYYQYVLIDLFKLSLFRLLKGDSYREIYLQQRLELNQALSEMINVNGFTDEERRGLFHIIQQTKTDLVIKY